VRLASLRDAPYAFSATLEDALALTQSEWIEGLARRTQFVACAGEQVVGTAGGIVVQTGDAAELISMWVHPDHRRGGVGAQLVDAVVDWARGAGFGEVRLWVADGNAGAEKLYAGCGFTRTGGVAPVRKGEPQQEFEMARRL